MVFVVKQQKYTEFLDDKNVTRWFENLKAKSILTATVYFRTLGYYCELNKTTPAMILREASKMGFRDSFSDFIRGMEKRSKHGSYLVRFKKVLSSWLKFNDIDGSRILNVNIRGEYNTPAIANERVPAREELASIVRKASTRGRIAIALMAFSGLRPESLGGYEGKGGLKLSDLPDLKITGQNVEFTKIPAQVIVRPNLSKARCK